MAYPAACVFDSFAVLAYLNDERGSDLVSELLERASRKQIALSMHVINLGEVYYAVHRKVGQARADLVYATVRAYPVSFVDELGEELLLKAARIKALYPLAYADAFAAATAMSLRATLVSGDPEFDALSHQKLLAILWK